VGRVFGFSFPCPLGSASGIFDAKQIGVVDELCRKNGARCCEFAHYVCRNISLAELGAWPALDQENLPDSLIRKCKHNQGIGDEDVYSRACPFPLALTDSASL
jgi:hypothetical protein